jgi:TctA family transporter
MLIILLSGFHYPESGQSGTLLEFGKTIGAYLATSGLALGLAATIYNVAMKNEPKKWIITYVIGLIIYISIYGIFY